MTNDSRSDRPCVASAGPLSPPPVPRADVNRFHWGLIALVALTGLFACFASLPLIWDGAYQFANTLQYGKPHVYTGRWPHAYQGRFHTWPLWWPVVWAGRVTDEPVVLQAIYGMPFLLAPAASLAACWWVVRRHAPGLMLWAIFGIAIGPLPGQCFAINDTILLNHLLWPIFVAMFVPLTRPQVAVLALLGVFQLAQPMGVFNCVGAAGAAILAGAARRDIRLRQATRAAVLLAAAGLGVWKIVAFPDSQAADEATPLELWKRWHNGVAGWPLTGLVLFWASAGCAIAAAVRDDQSARAAAVRYGRAAVAFALLGCGVWAAWAVDERRWSLALDYRRYVLPLSFPFFLGATIEGLVFARRGTPLRRPDDSTDPEAAAGGRAALPAVLAGTFALVLVVQSTLWLQMVRRLRHDVNNHPAAVVPASAVGWTYGTPLYHWSVTTVYLAAEGETQRRVVAYDPAWADPLSADPPRVKVVEWETYPADPTASGGYYDFRPVVEALRASGAGAAAAEAEPAMRSRELAD